ncbi:MAG: tetratricopeptide repeat protein, partial [Pseudanabaena sp.]
MASRFYALVFVALTGVLGMVSPSDLGLMTVLAQTADERKAEEDRILKSCRDNLNAQKFQEGLLSCQAALEDFKKIDNLRGQGIAITNIGVAYNDLNQYQKAIDNFQQALKIARAVKDKRVE